jgi:hypothetical protein
MAEMIPDRLPSRANAGEGRVFAALQRLPDNCIVYYEPVVGTRYPDFLVLIPAPWPVASKVPSRVATDASRAAFERS